jgi:hypothetical protein
MLELLAGTQHVPNLLHTDSYDGPRLQYSSAMSYDLRFMLIAPVGRHLTSDNPALILKVAVDIATVIAAMADKSYVHRLAQIVMMRISAHVDSAVLQRLDVSL